MSPQYDHGWCQNRSVLTLQTRSTFYGSLRVSAPRVRLSAPEIGDLHRLRPPLGRELPRAEAWSELLNEIP